MADDAVYVTTSRSQIVYRRENRRRDMQYGKPPPDTPVDTTELADKVDTDLTFLTILLTLVILLSLIFIGS